MRTLQESQQQFPSTPDTGLPSEAAARSRQQYGSNILTPLPREPLWKKFIEKFDEPIIKILLGAALLEMFVDLFQGNPAAAGIALVAVAGAFIALLVFKQMRWLPTLMFGSAVVLFFVGLIVPPHHPSVEGLAVMVAVILATGVAFLSEYKSDREFELLNAHKEKIRIKELRDGAFHTVGMEEVVVDDHVAVEGCD